MTIKKRFLVNLFKTIFEHYSIYYCPCFNCALNDAYSISASEYQISKKNYLKRVKRLVYLNRFLVFRRINIFTFNRHPRAYFSGQTTGVWCFRKLTLTPHVNNFNLIKIRKCAVFS